MSQRDEHVTVSLQGLLEYLNLAADSVANLYTLSSGIPITEAFLTDLRRRVQEDTSAYRRHRDLTRELLAIQDMFEGRVLRGQRFS